MTSPSPSPNSNPNPDPWEEAYSRFETPSQEIAKFTGRLEKLGADQWSRSDRVVELFCGRGNGLIALQNLGFNNIEGIDLSPTLAAAYNGPHKVWVADCRELPFEDQSRDILIAQGGFHHLPELPEDFDRTLAEAARVLTKNGRLVLVEPWLTPFLSGVHALCAIKPLRKCWPKLDALATMIHYERTTYENWLGRPDQILQSLSAYFNASYQSIGWGKIQWIGHPKVEASEN